MCRCVTALHNPQMAHARPGLTAAPATIATAIYIYIYMHIATEDTQHDAAKSNNRPSMDLR